MFREKTAPDLVPLRVHLSAAAEASFLEPVLSMFRAVFPRLRVFLAQHDRFSHRRPQSGVLWSRPGRLSRQAFSGLCCLKACHLQPHAPAHSCNGTTKRHFHSWFDVQMRERPSTCHRSRQHGRGALMAYHSPDHRAVAGFPVCQPDVSSFVRSTPISFMAFTVSLTEGTTATRRLSLSSGWSSQCHISDF